MTNLIDKVIRFAMMQSEARVLYVVEHQVCVRDVVNAIICTGPNITYKVQQQRIYFENGSTITILRKDSVMEYLYGAQLTHAVLDVDYCEQNLHEMLRTRIRSVVKHHGMGVYDRYGAYTYY